ncbi:MAG: hypothetical protein AAFU77_01840 [Myxococcota bacterium]
MFVVAVVLAAAVSTAPSNPPLVFDAALDVGLPTFASPGFGARLRFGQEGRPFRLGLTLNAGTLPNFAAEQFFESTADIESLTVQWDYAVSLDLEVVAWSRSWIEVFGRGSFGYESWDVTLEDESVRIFNNYVSVALGATIFPIEDVPFFVDLSFSGIVLFGQEDAYALGDDEVELRSFATNPSVSLGWRF